MPLALDNKHSRFVINCKTSKEIWEILSFVHEQASEANKIVLQKEFFELRMGKEETVREFVARGEFLRNRLQDSGVSCIDEATLVNRFVTALHKRLISFIPIGPWWNDSSIHRMIWYRSC